jgi:hypothetical protein
MTMQGSFSESELSSEVRALWGAGPATFDLPWRNYPREFGLQEQHADELLRIVLASVRNDQAEEIGDWVALHARRALAELRALKLMEPMLEQARADEGVVLDLPIIAGLVGPPAIPRLLPHLQQGEYDEMLKIAAIEGLMLVGLWHPEATDQVTDILCRSLQGYPNRAITVNGALVSAIKFLSPSACREIIEEMQALRSYHVDHKMPAYPRSMQYAVESN